MVRPPRPIGIAILTALQIISGIMDIIIGILLILGYAVFSLFVGGGFIATGLLLLGMVAFILGIFSFVLAYGLWTGRSWAWELSIIGAVIGLVLGILGLVFTGLTLLSLAYIAPIVLYAIILVYLNTRNVKAFFGRMGGIVFPPPLIPRPVPAPYPPMAQQPYPQAAQQPYYPQPPPWTPTTACPNCGAPLHMGVNFCDRCGTRLR